MNMVFRNRIIILPVFIILVAAFIYPALLVMGALSLLIYLFLAHLPIEERSSLKNAVIWAIILRCVMFLIIIVILYFSFCLKLGNDLPSRLIGHSLQLVRDLTREILDGTKAYRFLLGEIDAVSLRKTSLQGNIVHLHGGAWTQGVMSYVFGVSPVNLMIFPLLDIFSLFGIYRLGKLICGRRCALFSAWAYALMPNIVFIACSNIRFSLGLLFFIWLIYYLARFSRENRFKYIPVMLLILALFAIYRDKAGKPMFLIFLFALFLAVNIKFRWKAAACGIPFLAVALAKPDFLCLKLNSLLVDIVSSQSGFVSTGGSVYKIYPEIAYNLDIKTIPFASLVSMMPAAVLKGAAYFIFSPFPWQVHNVVRFYAYPFTIIWYVIALLAFKGMLRSLLNKDKEAVALLTMCVLSIVLLSLVIGNEGIAARYRQLITPIFFVYAGYALFEARRWSTGDN